MLKSTYHVKIGLVMLHHNSPEHCWRRHECSQVQTAWEGTCSTQPCRQEPPLDTRRERPRKRLFIHLHPQPPIEGSGRGKRHPILRLPGTIREQPGPWAQRTPPRWWRCLWRNRKRAHRVQTPEGAWRHLHLSSPHLLSSWCLLATRHQPLEDNTWLEACNVLDTVFSSL